MIDNPFMTGTQNRQWAQNRQKGFATSQVDERPLFNVNAPEAWTGMRNSNGSYDPERKVTRFVSRFGGTKGFINNLNTDKTTVNGIETQLSPEGLDFFKATTPMYEGGNVKQNVTDNVSKLYNNRSAIEALGGMREYNNKIQRDINNQYQIAQYEINSGNRQLIAQGQRRMEMVANAQHVFNQAQPKVSEGIRQGINNKIQGVKNFAGNNWWWMLPAGGALLYGLGNLFGRGGQMSQSGQSSVPMPSYWKTGFLEPKASTPQTQLTAQGFK